METRRYTLYDNTEWYFEKALAAYLCGEQKREDSLTAEDYRIISECAGNHIAFFLTWVVKHHYESDLFASVSGGAEALEALRSESMTGAEFLLTHCDGKLDGGCSVRKSCRLSIIFTRSSISGGTMYTGS